MDLCVRACVCVCEQERVELRGGESRALGGEIAKEMERKRKIAEMKRLEREARKGGRDSEDSDEREQRVRDSNPDLVVSSISGIIPVSQHSLHLDPSSFLHQSPHLPAITTIASISPFLPLSLFLCFPCTEHSPFTSIRNTITSSLPPSLLLPLPSFFPFCLEHTTKKRPFFWCVYFFPSVRLSV